MLPGWLPEPAVTYLAHTSAGHSIRGLARAKGCHASTILRQVRKVESWRDDPLIDEALDRLGRALSTELTDRSESREVLSMSNPAAFHASSAAENAVDSDSNSAPPATMPPISISAATS